jgi:hypothetical protein
MLDINAGRRWAVSAALSVVVVLGHGPRPLLPSARDVAHLPPRLRGCAGNLQSSSATRVIGPAGGTIRFGDHVLQIPADALDSAVTITATAPQSQYLIVDLAPHGLRFNAPVRLSMGYGKCSWDDSSFRIDYLSDDLSQMLEHEASSVHTDSHTIEAPINHFSVYAVAE